MTRSIHDLRLGLIGFGYWGRNLARNLDSFGVLKSIGDLSQSSLTDAGVLYPGAKLDTNIDGILADESLDAVVIATPAITHGEIARKALDVGKHVFVEKPLCLDIRQAYELRDLAATKNLVLMVGHLLLYHAGFIAVCGAVEKGEIGALRYMYSHRLSLGRIRREENALWSFAPHDISMMLALTGQTPISVSAIGTRHFSNDVADTTVSHLAFEGDVQGHVFVSWLHPYKEHRMVVVGDRGMIVFDDVQEGAEKVKLYRHTVGWQADIPSIKKANPEPLPYDVSEPLKAECLAYLEAVVTGKKPASNADEAIRVLKVLQACHESMQTSMPVVLNPDEEEDHGTIDRQAEGKLVS